MRSIWKKGSVTLVAVLMLCALASASASASSWYVGGKAMTAATKLAETTKVEETITFSVPDLATKITCSSVTLTEPELLTAGTLLAREGESSTTHFGGCKVVEGYGKGCKIEEEAGNIYGLEGTPSLGTSPEDKLETRATKTVPYVQFFLQGSCGTESGEVWFKGHLLFGMPTGQTESIEQAFVGEGTKSKTLTFFGDPAYVTGKFKVKLASGAKWSFH